MERILTALTEPHPAPGVLGDKIRKLDPHPCMTVIMVGREGGDIFDLAKHKI